MNLNSKEVEIFTDGACSGNPGKGGLGIILLYKGVRKEISEAYLKTTNNRMELLAAIKAIEALREPCIINLYSDSKYLVDSINNNWVQKWKSNGWKRNKKSKALNVDLWERLLSCMERHVIRFIWVKGHSNNIENQRCDELAKQAILSKHFSVDENYCSTYAFSNLDK